MLQANRMDYRIGQLTVLPDQMSFLNPLLIIILIPTFKFRQYPLLTSRNLLTKQLTRMTAGGLLAALSFVVAAFLQIKINESMMVKPLPDFSRITVLNP